MARRRHYYYENVFGVDQYSMKVLRALHTKYTRDYLSFFKSLSSMYGPSPQKREIDDAVALVQKVRGTIESVLQNQSIDRDDAKVLYELTSQIEQKKQDLLEQSADVKALRERLDMIQRETGISAKDLNVTRNVVRKSVKQAAESQKEGVRDFLSREAPGTLELGRKLAGGAASVLAGPFGPLLEGGYDVLKGANNIVEGIRKKFREKKERKFTSKLKTYTPSGDLGDISQARGVGTSLSGITGTAERETRRPTTIEDGSGKGRGGASLMEFWNKGAYRAKYTKELLGVLKDIRGKRGGKIGDLKNSLLGLVDDFVLLGKVIGPLILKGGGFALLAVGVANAAAQFSLLPGVIGDWIDAKKAERESLELAQSSYDNWIKVIKKEGIDVVAAKMGKSVRGLSEELAKEGQRLEMDRRRLRSGAGGVAATMGEVIMGPNVGPNIVERRNEIIRMGGGDPSNYTVAAELKQVNEKLSRQIEMMTVAAQNIRNREDEMNRKYPTTGQMYPNLHDSGDVLLNEQASGRLGIGD